MLHFLPILLCLSAWAQNDTVALLPPTQTASARQLMREKQVEQTAYTSLVLVQLPPPRTVTVSWSNTEPVSLLQYRTNMNSQWQNFGYQTQWFVGHGKQAWPSNRYYSQVITNINPAMFFRVASVKL